MKGKIDRLYRVFLAVVVGVLTFIGIAPVLFLIFVGLMIYGGIAVDERTDQVIFINESTAELTMVTLETPESRQTSELNRNGKTTIEWEYWPCTLSVSNGTELLAELVIAEDPNEDMACDRWYVVAQDSSQGLALTLTQRYPLDKVTQWGTKTAGVDLSDGVIRQFIYRHGAFGDGDTFLAMTFTPEHGAILEADLAQTDGWHPLPVHDIVEKIFFTKSGYCRDDNGENRVPRVENGWFFFRDMFNVQHGEDDENQWTLEGRSRLPGNFDAGIYDSDTDTLYLFEFDS